MFFFVFCHSSVFFFFKQKTAYEMRISDWSSDVCSSDLLLFKVLDHGAGILDIHRAPVQIQRLSIDPAITAAAAVIEIGHGKTALGPVLDKRIKDGLTRRGRSAIEETYQWRFFFGVHGGEQAAMCLAGRRGMAQGSGGTVG